MSQLVIVYKEKYKPDFYLTSITWFMDAECVLQIGAVLVLAHIIKVKAAKSP